MLASILLSLEGGGIGDGRAERCAGPLNLDLLGLVVDLNQVVLDIDAQTGSGNLLGNLLCAVTRLLDGGNLGAVANLLDQLLRILG